LRTFDRIPRIHAVEASRQRRRGGLVALGIAAIVASLLWTLLWVVVALLASALGGSTSGWLICSAALALGVFVFVFGLSLVRGRPPNRLGWVAVGVIVLALIVLPARSWFEDREAGPVNRAVERAYMESSGLENVTADCDRLEDNRDGSESWICDFGFEADYDVCFADIRRERGLVAAEVHGCTNGSFKP
jgi:hypothetical protein